MIQILQTSDTHATPLGRADFDPQTSKIERKLPLAFAIIIIFTVVLNFILIREFEKPVRTLKLTKTQPKVYCKKETKTCENGSLVSRTPPYCSFAKCN